MSVKIRLAKSEDQPRCSELLNVLSKATSDQYETFDSDTFNKLISNERGSLVVAEENKKILSFIPEALFKKLFKITLLLIALKLILQI